MEVLFKTDCGKLRDHNEDNGGAFVKGDAVLALIADGMGGHLAGEEASALAVQSMQESWEQYEPGGVDEKWLEEAVNKANRTIFNHAAANPECKGMGTTLVAAVCHPTHVTIANVGDSRGYLLSNNVIQQVTEDHSLVNELVKAGQLSEEDAAYHPRKNVLIRALGTDQKTKIDLFKVQWSESNCLLLCSDGLSNLVTNETMKQVLLSDKTIHEKASELIQYANDAGGNDNISVTLVLNNGGETE